MNGGERLNAGRMREAGKEFPHHGTWRIMRGAQLNLGELSRGDEVNDGGDEWLVAYHTDMQNCQAREHGSIHLA